MKLKAGRIEEGSWKFFTLHQSMQFHSLPSSSLRLPYLTKRPSASKTRHKPFIR
ncbi:hypothetical protein [Chryseobacterium sp.]|uniref:hypothetical protein n=2 Tax=Chryseobacterium group TaxID=2782232 RepID=UPI0023F9C6A9|nr:hypothetical protein [Chryseobacterium sp.]